MVYEGKEKRYMRVDQAELDLEEAEKKMEEINNKIKKEEEKKNKEIAAKEQLVLKENKKSEDEERMKMYERLMNSTKTVSAEEVARFKEIYGECDDEESAAVLLLNKENL